MLGLLTFFEVVDQHLRTLKTTTGSEFLPVDGCSAFKFDDCRVPGEFVVALHTLVIQDQLIVRIEPLENSTAHIRHASLVLGIDIALVSQGASRQNADAGEQPECDDKGHQTTRHEQSPLPAN